MSSAKPHPTAIPPELDAEMTPAVRVFVQSLLATIVALQARIAELERGRKTPQNSSLPPSTCFNQIRDTPSRSEANAIMSPVGEAVGAQSRPEYEIVCSRTGGC